MAYSTIKLYYGTEQKKWKLTPNKLMVIEDIEEYLNTFSFIQINNYQYVKNDIALTLKFDLSQRYTDPLQYDGIKYVRVQNSDTTKPVYYYVDNVEWRANMCVRLTLSMDILNTFKYGIDYKLSAKTKINRQHKNRLMQSTQVNKLVRIVDKYAENINPNLYKYYENKINDDGRKWYLIYMNENNPSESLINPVKCLLCADTEINARPFGTEANGRITPQMLIDDYFYYVASLSVKFTLDDGTIIERMNTASQWRVQMYKKDNIINLVVIDSYIVSGGEINSIKRVFTSSFVEFDINFSASYTNENSFNVAPYNEYPTTYVGTTQFNVDGAPLVRIAPISELDRTNAKIIKVIELPYCVDNFTYNDNVLLVNSNWLYVRVDGFNALQLANLNTKFENKLITSGSPYSNLWLLKSNTDINPTNERNDLLESKIFNSEFSAFKFVYDSFVFNYELEKLNISSIVDNSTITFNVSNTISGKFMFTFDDYITTISTQDYNNILVVSRNNDIALYNVAYINYIRNGYNYDIKNKNRTQTNAWVGTILGAIGTIGAFASSVYTGGFGIAMGVSMATTTASQIYNLVNTIKSSEEAIQQKQEQLQNQSGNVSGSDDIDLLNVYTDGNKAKWCYYRPSQQMLNVLYDLFYYCGYADNVQEIPNTHTRCWFNFIACDMVLDYTNNMNSAMVEQLKTMFNNGITFMHHYNGTWDIDQVKNNVEISLLS